MYGVSWQNLLMMNATIPPVDNGPDDDGKSTIHSGGGMDMWQMMERIKAGKGV